MAERAEFRHPDSPYVVELDFQEFESQCVAGPGAGHRDRSANGIEGVSDFVQRGACCEARLSVAVPLEADGAPRVNLQHWCYCTIKREVSVVAADDLHNTRASNQF